MGDEVPLRRLTTIVAADVAGYSRLTSQDEEGTLAALQAHRRELIDPKLAVFHGRIANTAGDSLLIEFPSVVEALRCSIEVQQNMRARNEEVPAEKRIEFRIGINVGDVIDADGDLLGEGVNIAARIEALASPGGICLSRSARDQVRDRLEVSLADMGEVEVKNIVRAVRVFRVVEFENGVQPLSSRPRNRRLRGIALMVVGAILALSAIAAASVGFDSGRLLTAIGVNKSASSNEQNLRPVMIVLPFDNLSSDPEQEYFADGLTEDLTSALARVPGFLVAARNTAFSYKGKSVNVQQLGTELGARYLLKGSARKYGDRVRLNAQLIETENGTHAWAESFDRPLQDIFILQDELVGRIVGSVASRLRQREGERALRAEPETLAAYDLTSRARLLFRQNNLQSIQEARELLRRANELDPTYARAFTILAQVEMFFFTNRVSDEYARPETAERVIAAAARGSALAPHDASGHAINGMAMRLVGDYENAAKEANVARTLAPNDPDVLAETVSVLLGVGDYENAVQTVRLVRALDPYINPLYVGVLQAQALFALGQFEESKTAAEFCLHRTPKDVRCHESLVRALGELGPPEEARAATVELLRLSPDYTIKEYKRRASKNRKDSAAVERWADGLRKAGVPE